MKRSSGGFFVCKLLVRKTYSKLLQLLYDLRIYAQKYVFCTVIALTYCTIYVRLFLEIKERHSEHTKRARTPKSAGPDKSIRYT